MSTFSLIVILLLVIAAMVVIAFTLDYAMNMAFDTNNIKMCIIVGIAEFSFIALILSFIILDMNNKKSIDNAQVNESANYIVENFNNDKEYIMQMNNNNTPDDFLDDYVIRVYEVK